jgi:hypothetical protein
MALPLGSEGSGVPGVKANTSPLRERKSGFCFEDEISVLRIVSAEWTYYTLVYHSKKRKWDLVTTTVYVVLRGVSRHCLRRR